MKIMLLAVALVLLAGLGTAAAATLPEKDPSPPAPAAELDKPKYLANLNSYLGNIDEVVGNQTINAVKELQSRYRITPEGIMVIDDAQSEPVSTSLDPRSSDNPSRGGRSRSDLLRNNQDLDTLARTVYGEARGESFEGQVAVAAVVLNRVESGYYGSTIREVIFQRNAFTAVRDGQYYLQPDESSYEAARAALNGWDPTNGALYYWNPRIATSRWVRTRTVTCSIGNHVFAV